MKIAQQSTQWTMTSEREIERARERNWHNDLLFEAIIDFWKEEEEILSQFLSIICGLNDGHHAIYISIYISR